MTNEIRKGIVIVTSEKTKDFLQDCINSCKQEKYPILIVSNGGYNPENNIDDYKLDIWVNPWNGFELAGIENGMEFFDEFILLQDTIIIKDQSIFDKAFDYKGCMYFTEELAYHYSAKFRTEILKKMEIPRVDTVRQATDNERSFGLKYLEMERASGMEPILLEPPVPCGNLGDPIVERHGRKGIVVANQWLEKHKTNY